MRRRAHLGNDCASSRFDKFRRLAGSGLIGASLISSGCVGTSPSQWMRNGFKVGPNYCRPPAPVADQWIGAEDPRVCEAPPCDGAWWDVFQDPMLNVLVARAHAQNPNLRAVGTRVLQARALQGIAVGAVFPQHQAVQGTYSQGTFGGSQSNFDLTAFNLSWELDFWGKYRRQVESANARLDASVENYDDALVTLLSDVASNYVQYRVTQQRIKIAGDNLQAQERIVGISEEQQRVGTSREIDLQQLRTLMEQTRASISALQIVQGTANDRLCILLGEPPRDLEPELGPGPELGGLPMPSVPTSVAVGIPADLLRRRPDIRSAERQVAAQSAQIGVAEADLYPTLAIGTTLGHADIGLSPITDVNGGVAFITPQFSWNVLNYGRIANNVHLQDARTQELIATYQNRVLIAAQEVQTTLRGFLRSQEQAYSLTRSAAASVRATQLEETLFADVKADVNRLFILENTQLQVQDQLAVSQGNVALNLINVYRALGGGWQIRLGQNPSGEAMILPLPPNAPPAILCQPEEIHAIELTPSENNVPEAKEERNVEKGLI